MRISDWSSDVCSSDLAAAVLGLLLLVPSRADSHLDPLGLLLAAGAAACWAFYILFGTRISRALGGDAVAWGMAIAMLLTMPFGMASAGAALFAPTILLIGLAVACLSSALPYSLEMKAMGHLPAPVVGLLDRKSVVSGKSVSVRVDLGGRRRIKKKNKKTQE